MLEDVGANHKVVLPEGGQIIAIEVNAMKRRLGNFRQEEILLVGERHLTAAFHKLSAKNSVAAAEIKGARLLFKGHSTPFQPGDGVLRLESIKGGVISVPQILGQKLMDDHRCSA